MVRVDLLRLARERGLCIAAEGDRLVIRGPKKAGDLVREILACKDEVLALLRDEAPIEVPEPLVVWFAGRPDQTPGLAEACASLAASSVEIRCYGQARWGSEARRYPVEILAGFYATDLAVGLEAVIGPWGGWEALRDELEHMTGPEVLAAVWSAYASLPVAEQYRVQSMGDASTSPPGCIRQHEVKEAGRG